MTLPVWILRESHKEKIHENLTDNYHFVPICAETLGLWGPQGLALIKMIGKKLSAATGDPRSTFYLFQKLTMAVQRGNSQSILGTQLTRKGLEEVFDFECHNCDT